MSWQTYLKVRDFLGVFYPIFGVPAFIGFFLFVTIVFSPPDEKTGGLIIWAMGTVGVCASGLVATSLVDWTCHKIYEWSARR